MANSTDISQTIYDHGGSRIWIEKDGNRKLIADTYTTKDYALALRDFTEQWLRENTIEEDSL